jgi:hypothetical protein
MREMIPLMMSLKINHKYNKNLLYNTCININVLQVH